MRRLIAALAIASALAGCTDIQRESLRIGGPQAIPSPLTDTDYLGPCRQVSDLRPGRTCDRSPEMKRAALEEYRQEQVRIAAAKEQYRRDHDAQDWSFIENGRVVYCTSLDAGYGTRRVHCNRW